MQKKNHIRTAVLKELLNNEGAVISGSRLSGRSGSTRQSVWKTVEALRSENFVIESVARKGYRLLSRPVESISVSYIDYFLDMMTKSFEEIVFLDTVGSTQTFAKELARKKGISQAVIIAKEQTSGRGRMQREWLSPTGGIYFSILTRPVLEPSFIQLVNFAAALAVLDGLQSELDIKCSLKWPNDILYRDLKLCGILSEASLETDRVHYVITGIGMNAKDVREAFPEEIASRSTALQNITGDSINRSRLIAEIILSFQGLLNQFQSEGPAPLIEKYRMNCSTLGRKVSILTGSETVTGIAVDIEDDGQLTIRNSEGVKMKFSAGDVIHAPHV